MLLVVYDIPEGLSGRGQYTPCRPTGSLCLPFLRSQNPSFCSLHPAKKVGRDGLVGTGLQRTSAEVSQSSVTLPPECRTMNNFFCCCCSGQICVTKPYLHVMMAAFLMSSVSQGKASTCMSPFHLRRTRMVIKTTHCVCEHILSACGVADIVLGL